MRTEDMQVYYEKVKNVFLLHNLKSADAIRFSNSAILAATTGNWNFCALELREQLGVILGNYLSEYHRFLPDAYVRTFRFDDGREMKVAIINQQSKEWYGSPNSIESFDFLHEQK